MAITSSMIQMITSLVCSKMSKRKREESEEDPRDDEDNEPIEREPSITEIVENRPVCELSQLLSAYHSARGHGSEITREALMKMRRQGLIDLCKMLPDSFLGDETSELKKRDRMVIMDEVKRLTRGGKKKLQKTMRVVDPDNRADLFPLWDSTFKVLQQSLESTTGPLPIRIYTYYGRTFKRIAEGKRTNVSVTYVTNPAIAHRTNGPTDRLFQHILEICKVQLDGYSEHDCAKFFGEYSAMVTPFYIDVAIEEYSSREHKVTHPIHVCLNPRSCVAQRDEQSSSQTSSSQSSSSSQESSQESISSTLQMLTTKSIRMSFETEVKSDRKIDVLFRGYDDLNNRMYIVKIPECVVFKFFTTKYDGNSYLIPPALVKIILQFLDADVLYRPYRPNPIVGPPIVGPLIVDDGSSGRRFTFD